MKHFAPGLALALLASPLAAMELATKDQIMAALPGNTVQGSMMDGTGYTEFYDADGTIRGADYTGAWGLVGNQMCFAYGDDPASCWHVRLDGTTVTWVRAGADDGSGSIVPGNPNGF